MIEKLERLVDEIGAVHSKLILLVSAPRTGKTTLLCALAKIRNATSLSIGAALGSRLSAIPQKQRHLQANTTLRTRGHARGVSSRPGTPRALG